MKLKWGILALAFLAFSCGPNEQEKQKIAKGEAVMAVHDEAMPKMGLLTKKRAELKEVVQQMKADTTHPFDSAFAENATEVMVQLQKASDSMMDWMHNYKYPADDVPFAEAIQYIDEQKAEIEAIRNQTDQVLEDAEKLLSTAQKAMEHESEEE